MFFHDMGFKTMGYFIEIFFPNSTDEALGL